MELMMSCQSVYYSRNNIYWCRFVVLEDKKLCKGQQTGLSLICLLYFYAQSHAEEICSQSGAWRGDEQGKYFLAPCYI